MKSSVPKVVKLSQNISPFGGISYVNAEFTNSGLSQLIDNELGIRGSGTGYSYSNIFRTMNNVFFCGGECAEDIQVHLRASLEQIPNNAVPGPDTLLRGIKKLAVDNTAVTVSGSDNVYQFNINNKMNRLNLKSLLLTGQLEKGGCYDFDYDNQIISHEKYDAKRTYKKNTGYFPGVATIGNKIIYVENRDGNANVKTGQAETLERAYTLVEEQGMTINRSRMDAGSYSEDIVKVVSSHSKLFYIRANRCMSLTERIRQIEDWQSVEINNIDCQVASLEFTQFLGERRYRLVVQREKSDDTQIDLFTGDNFIYRCILTNDQDSTEQEIIEYYNQRGSSEQTFDIQNNDFGWNHLPCSDMNHNTVYLILTAMIKNFYNYIVQKVSKIFKDIPPTSRIKRFIFRFICVPARWYYRGRQWTLGLYTDRPYEKLFAT
jgi:Transposase DDE domain.